MSDRLAVVSRIVIVLVGVAVAAALGWLLFVVVPAGDIARLLGVVLTIGVATLGARFGSGLASSLFPGYDVAEVAVEGPITRDGPRSIPTGPSGTSADDVVEQIERADEDDNAEALLLKLNTPGGEVVPSEDIRLAAASFDGPTVAYATDVCASGGYWIASGCDAVYARDGSVVGSIGVVGSQVNANELADRVGLRYERLAAGEFKDAGAALKEMTEDEREYLQGLVDGYYEEFVERVTEGRDLDSEAVRETEARVYLGEQALELGLIDRLGTRDDVEERLADDVGVESVTVREFQPERGLAERLGLGARGVAYGLGAGIASVVVDGDASEFELRL